MTKDQEKHLARLIKDLNRRMKKKYRKGAEEHGGRLWLQSKRELLLNALDECLDLSVYIWSLLEKLPDEE